jgi:hypothetical protein
MPVIRDLVVAIGLTIRRLKSIAHGLAHEIGSDRLIVGRHAPDEHFPVRAL